MSRLFPESSPPLVRFLLRVTLGDERKASTFHEGLLRTPDDFAVPVHIYFKTHFTCNDFPIHSLHKVIIDVEFWDLKISPSDISIKIPNSQMTEVVTRGGHAQWKVPFWWARKQSDPFKIGVWNWHLSVDVKGSAIYFVRLFPEPSLVTEEKPPLARFFLCVAVNDKNTSTVHEGLLRTRDDFAFSVENASEDEFTIDVEFWNLKISPLDGGKDISVWPCDETVKPLATRSTPKYLSRMLNESVLTDITINMADGTLLAHRAVLSASSHIFHSMFTHDLKEKQSSTIDIADMTSESCTALLAYIYGTISEEEFWKQRSALLAAANKYDISDLKGACEESLIEDINLDNVIERLQKAKLYRLDKLKKGCVAYLLDFGKKYDVLEYWNGFFREADKELVVEMFQEVLALWYKA